MIRAGLLVVRNGGTTRIAARAARSLARAFGREPPVLMWRIDVVEARFGGGDGPRLLLEPVGPITTNLQRVSAVLQLASTVQPGEAPASVETRLDAIERQPSPWGRWTRLAAAALAACAFARAVGGDAPGLAIAAAAAACGQEIRDRLHPLALPSLLEVFAAAAAASILAAALLLSGASGTVAAVLIGSVVCLVPGLALINGFFEFLSYRYLVVGFQRIAQAIATFLAITVALALALAIAP